MINNVSFNGHARIDTQKTRKKDQLEFHSAINDGHNNNQIKRRLPDNVEIKYSSEQKLERKPFSFKKVENTYGTAEFFKDNEKIGEITIKKEPRHRNFFNTVVFDSVVECLSILKTNQEPEIIDQLKSKDGLVI